MQGSKLQLDFVSLARIVFLCLCYLFHTNDFSRADTHGCLSGHFPGIPWFSWLSKSSPRNAFESCRSIIVMGGLVADWMVDYL